MARFIIFLYGLLTYFFFFGTFLYAMFFVTGVLVPKTLHSGEQGELLPAILINSAMLGAFAIQHMIMARPWFKRWWTKIIPQPAERPTFVLVASAILAVTMWQWRPMTDVLWNVEQPILRNAITALSFFGFGVVLYSSFLIDHFDLFGLRQVILHLRGKKYTSHPFMERSLYRIVRHPLMVGFLIAFWSTPTMTTGHLLFAILTTGYIIVGVQIEERDLVRFLGEKYENYRQRTPAFIPFVKPRRASRGAVEIASADTTATSHG